MTFRDYDEQHRWEMSKQEEEHWRAREEELEELGLAEDEERFQQAYVEVDQRILKLKAQLRRDSNGEVRRQVRAEMKKLRAERAKLLAEWKAKVEAAKAQPRKKRTKPDAFTWMDTRAAECEEAAATGKPPRHEQELQNHPMFRRVTPLTAEERAARIVWWREEAIRYRAEAAQKRAEREERLRVELEELKARRAREYAELGWEEVVTPEEVKPESAKRRTRREIHRAGEPDPRTEYTRLQEITGKERHFVVIIRPDGTPLKAEEAGAIVSKVWARSKQHAHQLVEHDIHSPKGSLPGIREQRTLPEEPAGT